MPVRRRSYRSGQFRTVHRHLGAWCRTAAVPRSSPSCSPRSSRPARSPVRPRRRRPPSDRATNGPVRRARGCASCAAPTAGCCCSRRPACRPVPAPAAVRCARREAHLARFAADFGVRAADLRVASTGRVAGRTVVRFQQTRAGLPVFGGQLVTVLNASGGLLSLSGETARAPLSASAYRVAASTAALRARRAVAASTGVGTDTLAAARPTRWLLDRSLLDPTSPATLRPVWRTTVTRGGPCRRTRRGVRRRRHRPGRAAPE